MEIFNPTTPTHVRARNSLLQSTMRPEQPLFNIADEYPIVLASENHRFSWCLDDDNTIIAHANLWPRTLVTPKTNQTYSVGLVGNVATDPSRQGQGIMRTLMEHVTAIARNSDLCALVLWSDLLKFYQKLGFESVGQEFRLTLDPKALEEYYSGKFLPRQPDDLKDEDFAFLMSNRPVTAATLLRTPEEFRRLLTIPCTYLFTSEDLSEGYGIVGKGYDMAGVIHEWAASHEHNLLSLCADIARALMPPQLMLLCPKDPEIQAFKVLSSRQALAETHPMALALYLSENQDAKKALQTSFIWGLDSI